MPRKKNRRKENQAKRRAEEAAKAPKPGRERRAGVIAHHRGGLSMVALALMVNRLDRRG